MTEVLAGLGALVIALAAAFLSGRRSGRKAKTSDDVEALRSAKENYEKISRMDDDSVLREFDRMHKGRR